jgi:hypothetical protein
MLELHDDDVVYFNGKPIGRLRALAKRTKEDEAKADLKSKLQDANNKIHDLKKRVTNNEHIIQQLATSVNTLHRIKITKPSLSPELLDAERYMDDFQEIRKRHKVERFAQKQRIKKKLARIERMSEPTSTSSITILKPLVLAPAAAIATFIVFVLIAIFT